MQSFVSKGTEIFYERFDPPQDSGVSVETLPIFVWGHGWGQNHQAFMPMVESLRNQGTHYVLDFPGFGESPPPPEDWSTADYADAVAEWMSAQGFPPVIWVGHSFGCRVGVQIGARHPALLRSMCLVAAAGLKRKRPPLKRLYFFLRIRLFKALKVFLPKGEMREKILAKFGSADYKNAGPMRTIFIRVVNEDLSAEAAKISCPVRMVFGRNDTETPPEFGERYLGLMKDAELLVLDGHDHYSVLAGGRHQVIKVLHDLLKNKG